MMYDRRRPTSSEKIARRELKKAESLILDCVFPDERENVQFLLDSYVNAHAAYSENLENRLSQF